MVCVYGFSGLCSGVSGLLMCLACGVICLLLIMLLWICLDWFVLGCYFGVGLRMCFWFNFDVCFLGFCFVRCCFEFGSDLSLICTYFGFVVVYCDLGLLWFALFDCSGLALGCLLFG